MTDTAKDLQTSLHCVVDAIDEHHIQISDGACQRLIDAADTLGWLAHQADWRALVSPLPPSEPTPEPVGAEADYRERVAQTEQALQEAHAEHRPPAVRSESLMHAQVQATLALAAATLMAAEPRTELGYQPDTVEIRDFTGEFSRTFYAGPLPQQTGESIEDYVDRLNESLEAAQLARIEAQNPGIDMEDVKAHRQLIREQRTGHAWVTGVGSPCQFGCEDSLR